MNIDLLYSNIGEAGLIASENFVKKIAGVSFSLESGVLTLEFKDMETKDLNIPVDGEFIGPLHETVMIFIGAAKKGHIAQAYKVPFMIADNPYGNPGMMAPMMEDKQLVAFNHFIRNCVVGQPVHREDLGDEIALSSVLGDASPAQLEFAPHLAKRHALEARPTAAPQVNVPGFSVPGMGGGSSGGGIGGHYSGGGQQQGGSGASKPPPKDED